MSQFLICKSYNDLSQYGCKISHCNDNKSLYYSVVNKYLHGECDYIWVIEDMCCWIEDIERYINILNSIATKSELLIMWYGTDYCDLDEIHSIDDMNIKIYSEIDDPCIELYMLVILKS